MSLVEIMNVLPTTFIDLLSHRDLPPELRIMIFELVVTNYDNTVYMSLSRFKPGIKLRRRLAESRMLPRYRNLRLLRANKRIYHEATAVFYQQVFSFNTATSLHTFLALQRPQTIPLLRHIALRVEAQEWPLMLGISVQMCQLVSLSTLSLSEVTCSHGREFEGYLRHTNRPPTEEYWGEQSIVMWDKLTGIKLAKDLYAPMFPLFRKVISERGVDGLARMIECKANYRCHGHFWPTDPIFKTFEAFKNFWRAPDTKERQILRATSMAQEFVRLIGLDPS